MMATRQDSNNNEQKEQQRFEHGDRVRFWVKQANGDDDDASTEHHNAAPGRMGVIYCYDAIAADVKKGNSLEKYKLEDCIRVELVMPSAQWEREAFRMWCQEDLVFEIFYLDYRCSFEYRNIHYDLSDSFVDEVALHLDKALRKNTSIDTVIIESNNIAGLSEDRLQSLIRAILALPKLKRLELDDISDQELVDMVWKNLGSAARNFSSFAVGYSVLPTLDALQHLSNDSRTTGLAVDLVRIGFESTSWAHSEAFFSQLARQHDLFHSIRLGKCKERFACALLQALMANDSRIRCLGFEEISPDGSHLLIALSNFLQSRHRPLDLKWYMDSRFDLGLCIDTILQHDCVQSLHIDCDGRDVENGRCPTHFLQNVSDLGVLSGGLPFCECSNNTWSTDVWQGLAANKSLRELSVECPLKPDAIFQVLQSNHTLEKLSVERAKHSVEMAPHVYELEESSVFRRALGQLAALKNLTINRLWVGSMSFCEGTRMNMSLEEITISKQPEIDEHVRPYLSRNKWFHKHQAMLLDATVAIPANIWPRILAKVSTNPNFLFLLARGRTELLLQQPFVSSKRQTTASSPASDTGNHSIVAHP